MSEHNDHLLQACRRGDRRAQYDLYEQYKGRMFALCLRYAGNRQDAEDWLQEGFVKVFRDIHQYSGQGVFEGWIRKVMLHTILENLRRRKQLFLPADAEELEYMPEKEPIDFEGEEILARHLLALLLRLPPGFRTVLNLYALEGYTHQEIAGVLGISVGTSKSQLHRAKAQLRAMLEKHPIL